LINNTPVQSYSDNQITVSWSCNTSYRNTRFLGLPFIAQETDIWHWHEWPKVWGNILEYGSFVNELLYKNQW